MEVARPRGDGVGAWGPPENRAGPRSAWEEGGSRQRGRSGLLGDEGVPPLSLSPSVTTESSVWAPQAGTVWGGDRSSSGLVDILLSFSLQWNSN